MGKRSNLYIFGLNSKSIYKDRQVNEPNEVCPIMAANLYLEEINQLANHLWDAELPSVSLQRELRRYLMSQQNIDQITETVLKRVQTASKILQIKEPTIHFNKSTDFSNPNALSMYIKSRNLFNDKWLDRAN